MRRNCLTTDGGAFAIAGTGPKSFVCKSLAGTLAQPLSRRQTERPAFPVQMTKNSSAVRARPAAMVANKVWAAPPVPSGS